MKNKPIFYFVLQNFLCVQNNYCQLKNYILPNTILKGFMFIAKKF